MKKLIFILGMIILASISFVIVRLSTKIKIDYNIFDVEINTNYKISDFIKTIKNGTIINGEKEIAFDNLGKKDITIIYKDNNGNNYNDTISIKIIDTKIPIIEAKESITIIKGKKIDLLKGVKVSDNSNEKIIPTIIGEYNINKEGIYNLKYSATDSSNNTALFDFKLIVKKEKETLVTTTNKYYIKVNKTLNVVMIYKNNDLIKTMICSAGNNTPTGTFTIDAKAETLALEGGVYGHYTTRFLKSRGMWFHSVPYFSKPKNGHWDDLEYEEYNKLGTLASLGCIRLTTIDAKWIYDNIPKKTEVEIYESEELPSGVKKPSAIKIDVNSDNKGWDPTDPDPANPWKKN